MPIIFIDRSNSPYLQWSLAQAADSNSTSMIYLLGVEANNRYDFVEHYRAADFSQEAGEFNKAYAHRSSLSRPSELWRFQRWFILKEFMERANLKSCLYLAAETLLYCDVTDDVRRFSHVDFALPGITTNNLMYLGESTALQEFCQFLRKVYTRRDQFHYNEMVAHYANHRRHRLNGGVNDMVAFRMFAHHVRDNVRVLDVSEIIEGSAYDHDIASPRPAVEMEVAPKRKYHQRAGVAGGNPLRTSNQDRRRGPV